MATLFGLLFLLMVLCMLLGLINPSLVLRGAQKKTRLRAFIWYGVFAFLSMGALGASLPKESTTTPPKEAATPVAAPDPAQVEAAAKQQAEWVKSSVRRTLGDLIAMDQPGSDAAGFASNMAQSTGKGVGLGDVYGAFKAAKIAADESFSRLMRYSLPKGLPATVHSNLDGAHAAFRRAAMLRSDIAEAFMEWLDSRKPSLANTVKEKSDQVTLAMTKAVVSATEAMTAAGFSEEEVKAELAAMSGKSLPDKGQTNGGAPGKKKKG